MLFEPTSGCQRALSLANTTLARTTLLDWLAQQHAHLVIPDTLLAVPCYDQATRFPLVVWIAPSPLLEAIRFAAEIGTMRVTEQIDAMATMAVSPIQYLVVPRVVAAVLMLPCLTMVFDCAGFVGAYFVATLREASRANREAAGLPTF